MSKDHRIFPRHPFEFIPPGWWPRIFWPLLGLTILLMAVFGITGAPLTTAAAPYGVISLELAGSIKKFIDILSGWDAEALRALYFGLGLDYLFIVVYASMIAFGCGIAAKTLRDHRWPFAKAGNVLSWGVILAGLFDIIENISLMILLWGNISNPWPAISRWCAIFKFGLIFISIVYVIYGGVVWLVERISRDKKEVSNGTA